MMCKKFFIAALAFLNVVPSIHGTTQGGNQCIVKPADDIKEMNTGKESWPGMMKDCVEVVRTHILLELRASITYITLGAHFLEAPTYRPGVANLFLTHAGEERQHAKALMEYLSMRGGKSKGKDEDQPTYSYMNMTKIEPHSIEWNSTKSHVFHAIKKAYELEKEVRDEFKKIIRICEIEDTVFTGKDTEIPTQDFHISDVLTGEFLDEQHKGVRELAGHLSTLSRLIEGKGIGEIVFAEFEFDRTLTHGA